MSKIQKCEVVATTDVTLSTGKSYEKTLNKMLAICDAAIVKREARNAANEAFKIITDTLPNALAKKSKKQFDVVREIIIKDMFRSVMGDDNFSEFLLEDSMKEGFKRGFRVDLSFKIVAYCGLAVKAFLNGNESLAWTFASDANYWCGVLSADTGRAQLPNAGEILANLRHVKARQERITVEDYWKKNVDPKLSAQKAADKILLGMV